MNSLAENTFADRPDGPLVRESRQQRVRAVLMTYCTTQLKHDGMTAWEVAGKILEVLEGDHAN